MNICGPISVTIVLVFNVYAVMYFYVFPYTDILDWDADIVTENSKIIHYTLFACYVILLLMTIWSFITASCTDPGYVPRNITNYDSAKLPERELLLWNYIKQLGIDPNYESGLQSMNEAHHASNSEDAAELAASGKFNDDD